MSSVCSSIAQFPICRMVLALAMVMTLNSFSSCTCFLSHSASAVCMVMVICVMCDLSFQLGTFFPELLDLYSWMIPLIGGFSFPMSISMYWPIIRPVFSVCVIIASGSRGSCHRASPAPLITSSCCLVS